MADGEVEVALALWNVYNVRRRGDYVSVVGEDGSKPLDLGGSYYLSREKAPATERMPAQHSVSLEKLLEVGLAHYGAREVVATAAAPELP